MIPVQNIYYMLAYAFQVLNENGYKDIATEQFNNVRELCAAILTRGVSLHGGMSVTTVPGRWQTACMALCGRAVC